MTALLKNAPAEPAALFAEEVDDLMLEARNWLDGEPITNEQQAEAVSSLLNRLRRVAKDADEARKVEKKPHDDAAKSVQAKWTPIISKAELAASTAKQALAPYLRAIEDQQRAEAEAARKEAERLAEIARAAHQQASGNLEASEGAERLLKAAAAAEKDAVRAGKAKAHAAGGERAVGLRSYYTAEVVDPVMFGKWAWEHRRDQYVQFLHELAEREARLGIREIPGLKITEERKAV
jgi:hypothetical protein